MRHYALVLLLITGCTQDKTQDPYERAAACEELVREAGECVEFDLAGMKEGLKNAGLEEDVIFEFVSLPRGITPLTYDPSSFFIRLGPDRHGQDSTPRFYCPCKVRAVDRWPGRSKRELRVCKLFLKDFHAGRVK